MKRLLIMGLDPGTTTGYAILDINGEIIKIASTKGLISNKLILSTLKYGRVIVVGSDINPAPKYVKKFSKKLGAKLTFPNQRFSSREKNEFIETHVKDLHQRDALFAAKYAYKKISPLLKKIDRSLKKRDKEYLTDKIKLMLLQRSNCNISEAINAVED